MNRKDRQLLFDNQADRESATYSVQFATVQHLDAIKEIADSEKSALGFVHRGSLARAVVRSELFVALHEEFTLGFCEIYRRRDGITTVYHLAVRPHWRRRGIGSAIIDFICRDATCRNMTEIRLKCPTELQANRFYADSGFTIVGTEPGSRRSLNVFAFPCSGLEVLPDEPRFETPDPTSDIVLPCQITKM